MHGMHRTGKPDRVKQRRWISLAVVASAVLLGSQLQWSPTERSQPTPLSTPPPEAHVQLLKSLPNSHKGTRVYLFYDEGKNYHETNLSCPVPWVSLSSKAEALHRIISSYLHIQASIILIGCLRLRKCSVYRNTSSCIRSALLSHACLAPIPALFKQKWTRNRAKADVVWQDVLEDRFDLPFPTLIKQAIDELGPEEAQAIIKPLHRAHLDQKYLFMTLESSINYPHVFESKQAGYDFSCDYRIWRGPTPGDSADIPALYFSNPTAPTYNIDFRAPPLMPKRTDAIMSVFISNCEAKNDRERVLRELMDLVPVHSYGECMHNADEPPWPEGKPFDGRAAKLALGAQYHFMFVPENSNDVSYVSEKIYDALAAGTIPVYLGAPDVARFVPHPSAVINALDFETVADLAHHLLDISGSESKYLAQFAWKQREYSADFKRVMRLASRTAPCRLAMKLEGLDFEADLEQLEF